MNIYEKYANECADRAYRAGYQDAYLELVEQLRKVDYLYDSKERVIDYLNNYIEGILKENE